MVDARAGTLDAVADDPDVDGELLPSALGPNAWLVDEMYEQYLADPASVSESWQDFFADYRRDAAPQVAPRPPAADAGAAGAAARRDARRPSPGDAAGDAAQPPGGAAPPVAPGSAQPGGDRQRRRPRAQASRSAAPPPASSPTWRPASRSPRPRASASVPAKLLEVNRRVINGYLGRTRGGKVRFTHLIGYAVVRAIHETVPVMNSSYVEDADGQAAA